MTRFDGFDTALLLSGITLVGAAMVLGLGVGPRAERFIAVDPAPSTRQELVRAARLLELGQAGESRKLLQQVASMNPAVPEVHMLLGCASVQLRDFPSSVRAFRTSLQLDPDYADPKSEKFTGKSIRAAIAGGTCLAKGILEHHPADPGARSTLDDAHYLERMLAGGCE